MPGRKHSAPQGRASGAAEITSTQTTCRPWKCFRLSTLIHRPFSIVSRIVWTVCGGLSSSVCDWPFVRCSVTLVTTNRGARGTESAAGGRRRRRGRLVGRDAAPGEVVLDEKHVVRARAIDHGEQCAHARDLLALLVEEPAEEALAHGVVVLARDLDEARDLLGHRLLLRQRGQDRLSIVVERDLRRGHRGDHDRLAGIEEVLDDHHRVVPLLDRLPVEVRSEPGQRLRVVVDGDRHVLLRCGELACDLCVQGVGEAAHVATIQEPPRSEGEGRGRTRLRRRARPLCAAGGEGSGRAPIRS